MERADVMATMTRPRPRRTRYPSEPQWATTNGWVVARKRPHQQAYEVLYRGQAVGWVVHTEDGWRWHLSWSPGTASRAPRFGVDRESKRAYSSWQVAVSAIARTDVGVRVAGGDVPAKDTWRSSLQVRGEPWVPRTEVKEKQ